MKLCETSMRRLNDGRLILLPGSDDAIGGRVRCLLCGRELTLVEGLTGRPVAPSHPSGSGSGRKAA